MEEAQSKEVSRMASPVLGALQGLVSKWEPTTPEGQAYEADLQRVISRFGSEETEAPTLQREAPTLPAADPRGSMLEGPPPRIDRNAYGSGPFSGKQENGQLSGEYLAGYKQRPCK